MYVYNYYVDADLQIRTIYKEKPETFAQFRNLHSKNTFSDIHILRFHVDTLEDRYSCRRAPKILRRRLLSNSFLTLLINLSSS